jgi:precorrin-2 dehydrogenase/sirohydrochlorin ferrochelatase
VRRQRFLKGLVEGDVGALLERGERKAAGARLREELKTLKSSGEST